MNAKIIILSGPSGSGKTTLYEKLLKDKTFKGKIVRSISATTRPRRPGEKNGRDYFFVSPKMFIYKIRAGHFLEHEKVFGNYYGTPKKYVTDQLKKGRAVLLAIDVKGAKQVMRQCADAVTIFVKTPSFDVLKQRLKTRGSEDAKTYAARIKTAKKELAEEKKYAHVIVNDRVEKAFAELKKIVSQQTSS